MGDESAVAHGGSADATKSTHSGHGLARQVLPTGDGWGSVGAGTTGGSAADRDHVVTVRTRDQLVAAVAGDAPKIVYVKGRIDANTDSMGRRLSCADYAQDG